MSIFYSGSFFSFDSFTNNFSSVYIDYTNLQTTYRIDRLEYFVSRLRKFVNNTSIFNSSLSLLSSFPTILSNDSFLSKNLEFQGLTNYNSSVYCVPILLNKLNSSTIFNLCLDRLLVVNQSHILRDAFSNKNLPDIPWSETFNGTRRALRFLVTPEDILSWYAEKANVSKRIITLLKLPTNLVIPFLSLIKTIFHNNCDFLDKYWKNYLDLAVLAGYPEMKHRESSDNPQLWLSSPVVSEYDSSWWFAAFKHTFYQNHIVPKPLLSYEQYVLNRWLWVTDGATRFSQALLDDELVKTKFGAAVSLSDSDLLDHAYLRHKDSDKIGVFLKPDEPGYKRRLIANVSLGPYLVAAYVRYYIETLISGQPNFAKLKVSVDDKVDVVSLIKTGSTMVPLDESAYDYHVSRESWLGFHAFLLDLDPNNDAFRLFIRYFHSATWSFEGQSGSWLAGMPSGLALTSFLNSWMNYIKQTKIINGQLQYAAGDDVLTAPFFNGVNLDVVASEYEKFGSAVNATKNWVSQNYSEYLKVLYHHKGTSGYPARVYSSLIWAGKERSFLPSDRLPELSELFKQFYDRLGVPFDEKIVARDLAASVSQKVKGFDIRMAKRWLHSPRAYGGFGRLPYNNFKFDWDVEILKKKKYTNVIIVVPDVNFYGTEVKLRVSQRMVHVNRSFSLGPRLRLPTPTTMLEWEARLSGEDNPIKGKFGRMALDIIPLPSVDFVSTATMSEFADTWQYNVLPNIKGNSQTILDALVLASLDLVRKVKRFMSNSGITEFSN